MNTQARQHPVSGFTLIEVVISSALMAMILVSAYLCFHASVSSRKDMEPRLEVIQNARVALALLSADLRAACPLDKNSQFLGMRRKLGDVDADNLDFATHNYTPRRPREGDFCEMSYFVDPDPETGRLSLWRRRNQTIAPNPLSGGSREEIAKGVAGVRFEYFDGYDWYDSWGDVEGNGKAQTSNRDQSNLSGMPEAVRVTLWFDSEPAKPRTPGFREERASDEKVPPPMVFETIARLNLAAASQTSSSSASGTTDTGEQPQQQQQGRGGTM